jgi:hypothetical protein
MHHAVHVDRDYFRGRRNGLRHERQRYSKNQASSQSNLTYTTQTTSPETQAVSSRFCAAFVFDNGKMENAMTIAAGIALPEAGSIYAA